MSGMELVLEPPLTRVAVRGGDLTVAVCSPTEEVNAVASAANAEPPVLAIHGVTATHRAWPYLAAALPGRTVLAPDLRGRGGSRGLPRPVGMTTHADDVAAVVDALAGGGPVDLVGHSMDGFVAAVLALRHPELVRRLVLVDGGLPFAPAELCSTQAGLAAIRQRLETDFPSREAYVELFRAHPAFAGDRGPALDAYAGYDAVERVGGLGASADALGAEFPQVATELVDDVNHYTICLSERGARAVSAALAR